MFFASFVVDLRQIPQTQTTKTTGKQVPTVSPVVSSQETKNKTDPNVTILGTDSFQTLNQTAENSTLQASDDNTTEPLIHSVSTNQERSDMEPFHSVNVYVNADVSNAYECVLSYTVSAGDYAVGGDMGNLVHFAGISWTNVTMTKNDDDYNGTIPGPWPYMADVAWKIYANDAYGNSIISKTFGFSAWTDP